MFCHLSSAEHQLTTPRTLIVLNFTDSRNCSLSNSQPGTTDTSCNRSTTHRHLHSMKKQSLREYTQSLSPTGLSRTFIDSGCRKAFVKDLRGLSNCGGLCKRLCFGCLLRHSMGGGGFYFVCLDAKWGAACSFGQLRRSHTRGRSRSEPSRGSVIM